MMKEPIAYLNGRLLPYSQATLPLHDAGFACGAIVTDRCRTFRGEFFRLDDHLRRFRRSCELAYIMQPPTREELAHIAVELLEQNALLVAPRGELAFVMFATPGPLGLFAGLDEFGPPTFGMYAFPLRFARFRPVFEQGFRVASSERVIAPECLDPTIKHRSRLAWWIAEQETGPAIPLFITPETHHVRESPAANFLAVRDGVVISPPRNQVLPGIGLATIEDLCHDLGIPFAERELRVEELVTSPGECLLTNSTFCVAGVSLLDRVPVPWPGPVWRRLIAGWGERVGVDLIRQMLGDQETWTPRD